MENKKLDLTKPVQTRDGRKAEIVYTKLKNNYKYPIIAIIQNYYIMTYTKKGEYSQGKTHPDDIINIPEKQTRWINRIRRRRRT
ncbi:MAG: hypothetical protein ACOC5T_02920 [Elusimicrobiota bacterium]